MLNGIDRIAEQGRKVLGKAARVAGAVIVGSGLSGINISPANADVNEPHPIRLADNSILLPVPLHFAGDAVLLRAPNGFKDFCGNSIAGDTIAGIIANRNGMRIDVIGNPNVFPDPLNLSSEDAPLGAEAPDLGMRGNPYYPIRAAAIDQAVLDEVRARPGQAINFTAVVLELDDANNAICKLSTNNGPFKPVVEAVPQTGQVGQQNVLSSDTIARCGNTVSLTDATLEIRGVGFPGPFDRGSVQAAMDRTVNCGGGTTPVRATESAVKCDPLATTSLGPLPDARMAGLVKHLEVRDLNTCPYDLFSDVTGVGVGQSYPLDLPAGWSFIVASTSVEIQREGGTAQQFKNGPLIVINGPFRGSAGVYEGRVVGVPKAWVANRLAGILPNQQLETHNPNLQPVTFAG